MIRLELDGELDITEQLDFQSFSKAENVTVGPAEKNFDESLEITSSDLERLIKELIREERKDVK